MKSLGKKKKTRVQSEEYFKNVEIKRIEIDRDEADRRICAVVEALIEIDQALVAEESKMQVSKEAS